ncbi:MAG: GNAT family N-acetyltransferase [Candidatus Dormibacteria bacterium]
MSAHPEAGAAAAASLETPRLLLRSWRDQDRAPFAALNADPEVMEHFPSRMTQEQSDLLVERILTQFRARGWGLWAVEVKQGPQFAGFVGLNPVDLDVPFRDQVEVGWRITRSEWGQGYATEAAARSLAFAFSELRLKQVVSFTSTPNWRSQRVMVKLGLTHDPADDFDHPRVPQGSPLRRQVLYRTTARAWAQHERDGREQGT